MKTITIIGGGFTGTMTAVQLLQHATEPFSLTIINEKESFNKGIAFNPYSQKHLLNVITAKMSAFKKEGSHFLDWVMNQKAYEGMDRNLIANSFLPRHIYGEYLSQIWLDAVRLQQEKKISVRVIDACVIDLKVQKKRVSLLTSDNERIETTYAVIATGNALPGNPTIGNPAFFDSNSYFQNPWRMEAVANLDTIKPVLIIGNGLTMVDTVIGLQENGFRGQIYSLSPNGFNILPHRHNGLVYTKLIDELRDDLSLYEIVQLFNKHIKSLKEFGVSPEPLIDSIRVYTQQIWKRLSVEEKKKFMGRLRHLWGVARHRIPLHIHDRLQQLRLDGKLHIISGKLIDITEQPGTVKVEYIDRKEKGTKHIEVSRVINCTGPDTNLMSADHSFLKKCLLKGDITQDELKLGIVADTETFEVVNRKGEKQHRLLTLGSNLKGELWESTAVNELRAQAEALAVQLIKKCTTVVDVEQV